MLNKPSLSSLFFNPLGRPLDRFIYWMPNESRSVATRFSPVSLPVWRVPRPHHHSPHFFGFLNGRERKNSKSHEYLWEKNKIIEGEMKYGCRVCVNTHKSMCAHFSYVTRQLLYNARCESYFSQEFFADLVRETGFSSYPFKNDLIFPTLRNSFWRAFCHPLSRLYSKLKDF
jgi:hypothetical protein